jgi:hypothetical protein
MSQTIVAARLRATSILSEVSPRDMLAATADPMECPRSMGPESPPLSRFARAWTA